MSCPQCDSTPEALPSTLQRAGGNTAFALLTAVGTNLVALATVSLPKQLFLILDLSLQLLLVVIVAALGEVLALKTLTPPTSPCARL